MISKAVLGSHCRAVHPEPTPIPSLANGTRSRRLSAVIQTARRASAPFASDGGNSGENNAVMKTKLLTLSAWAAFLMSAVSEYGFDVDFPFTPPLWLVSGICAMLFAATHAAFNRSYDCRATPQAFGVVIHANVMPANGALEPKLPGSLSRTRFVMRNRRSNAPVTADPMGRDSVSWEAVLESLGCHTASEVAQPVSFLNPATTRGPPRSDSNERLSDGALGRPAQQCYSAAHPSSICLRRINPSPPTIDVVLKENRQ